MQLAAVLLAAFCIMTFANKVARSEKKTALAISADGDLESRVANPHSQSTSGLAQISSYIRTSHTRGSDSGQSFGSAPAALSSFSLSASSGYFWAEEGPVTASNAVSNNACMKWTQIGPFGLEQCAQACVARGDQCGGFDYWPMQPKPDYCYIFLKPASEMKDIIDDPTSNDPTCQWNPAANHQPYLRKVEHTPYDPSCEGSLKTCCRYLKDFAAPGPTCEKRIGEKSVAKICCTYAYAGSELPAVARSKPLAKQSWSPVVDIQQRIALRQVLFDACVQGCSAQ